MQTAVINITSVHVHTVSVRRNYVQFAVTANGLLSIEATASYVADSVLVDAEVIFSFPFLLLQ